MEDLVILHLSPFSPLLEMRKGRIRESKGVAWSQRQSWEGKGGQHPGGVMKVVLKSLPCESGLAWVCRLTCFSSPQGSILAPSRFPLQSDFRLFHLGEIPCLGSASSASFFILTQRKPRGQTHFQGRLEIRKRGWKLQREALQTGMARIFWGKGKMQEYSATWGKGGGSQAWERGEIRAWCWNACPKLYGCPDLSTGLAKKFVWLRNTWFNTVLGENEKCVFYFCLKPNELFGQPNTFPG